MLPSTGVGDIERVVDPVRARQERGHTVEMAQDPVFLKPADMTDLPDRRLDEMLFRPEHLSLRESLRELELDFARIEEQVSEGLGGRGREVGVGHHRPCQWPEYTPVGKSLGTSVSRRRRPAP